MNNMKNYFLLFATIVAFASCVPTSKLRESRNQTSSLRADSLNFANQISNLNQKISDLNSKIAQLNNQNSQLGQVTATQQNQLDATQQTLQNQQQTLQSQQQRLQRLQDLLNQQRTQSEQLKNRMAEALKGLSSSDLTLTQKNGKVYVSLSENLLFPSGSAVVNPKGVDALAKLAAVLNIDPTVAVNIEGHTDSIPIKGKYQDNWDLGTARANSIVRILTNTYRVDPVRVIASGHSFYDPLDTNATAEGRAKNRRTEIILSPKLEEMYKLLE